MKNKTLKIILITLGILAVLYLSLPVYLQKALIYQKAGIDDYPIFENRKVKAGNYQPWSVSRSYNKKTVPKDLLAKFEKYRTVSWLVVQNDSIKSEEYCEGYNENSLSNSFSMSKSIIGLLVGIAQNEGKIRDLDQKVIEFFPELKGQYRDKLTIRNLLTMSSGFEWDEAYSSAFSKTTMAYYGNDLPGLILKLPVSQEPGKVHIYKSCDSQMLAFILEKATGMKVSDYASEKLWKPLGAKNDALWCLDRKGGIEKAFCCFNSDARDFARIGQLVLNKGKWNGIQLVPEKYLEESLTPLTSMKDDERHVVNYYGYQWWMVDYKGYHIPFARGLNGQYIFIIPQKNAVAVRLGFERSDKIINEHPEDVYTYLDAALQILD
ncbi:MAG: serine hydrolase [Bacteroidia bacterium]|nr:serine hydrolase [Bacteroidia bacterium]